MEDSTLNLTMVRGPREGETLDFKPRTAIRIGRLVRGNTLSIKDAGISTKHLSVDFESGKWVIRDLDSSNGTLLNNSKLPPFTPFNLRDGDVIDIGESTSIKVKIEVNIEDDGESRLRRNPRRRAAVKDGGSENVGSVVENRGRRGVSKRGKGLEMEDFGHNLGLINESRDLGVGNGGNLENVGLVAENRGRRVGSRRGKGLKEEDNEAKLGLVRENCDKEFENVGPVVENQGRRGGSKRGRILREDDNEADLGLVSGKCGGELENAVVVTKNHRGRGRPKKAMVLKNEAAEDLCEVRNLEGKENVSPGAEEPGQQVSLRRTRSLNNDEQSVSDSMLRKIPESSSLDCRELEIGDKRTRGGLRRKRDLGDSEDEGLELRDEASEAVEIVVSEEKENVEGLDLGRDTCKESASGSGVKESFIDVIDEVDLEKMTLGEWFDCLEVHLPKQIYDVTEEMIASMRERAKRFCEFIVQQQNEKGKLPVG